MAGVVSAGAGGGERASEPPRAPPGLVVLAAQCAAAGQVREGGGAAAPPRRGRGVRRGAGAAAGRALREGGRGGGDHAGSDGLPAAGCALASKPGGASSLHAGRRDAGLRALRVQVDEFCAGRGAAEEYSGKFLKALSCVVLRVLHPGAGVHEHLEPARL